MENIELKKVYGGAISATLINSVVKLFTFALEVGRALGSSIRRSVKRVAC